MKKFLLGCIGVVLLLGCGADVGDVGSSGAGGGSSGSGAGGGGGGGDPYDTPVVCTSMAYWMGGDVGNPSMHPGMPCPTCHGPGGKAATKEFDIAGTVYPTAHEPDDCNGVNVAGAVVVITDANGADHSLTVNSVGNFYHSDFFGFQKFAVPYHARVVFNGQERAMTEAQTVGNCNSCHTEGSRTARAAR